MFLYLKINFNSRGMSCSFFFYRQTKFRKSLIYYLFYLTVVSRKLNIFSVHCLLLKNEIDLLRILYTINSVNH